MIATNTMLFSRLDTFCADRGHHVSNAGSARWIGDTDRDKHLLINAQVSALLRFGPYRRLGRIDCDGRTYIATTGFDISPWELMVEQEVGAGLTTLILVELAPTPIATPLAIEDVVGYSQKGQPGYNGHDSDSIRLLFPVIRVLEVQDVAATDIWKLYWRLCLDETALRDSWVDPLLASALRSLVDDDDLGLPFQMLCRSVFDLDPGSLYLSLYRCLEALYAVKTCSQVAEALRQEGATDVSWRSLAKALDTELGWHPPEVVSLQSVFEEVDDERLQVLAATLGEPGLIGAEPIAKRVYKLRNRLVHYRPGTNSDDLDLVEWSPLCVSMASVVAAAYRSLSA